MKIRVQLIGLAIATVLCACTAIARLDGAVQVQATVSMPSPQPVGTLISFVASATDTNPGPVTYRFEITPVGSSTFQTVRDFSLNNSYDWYPITPEGDYQIRITARDYLAGETSQTVIPHTLTTRIVGGRPSLVLSNHPLVALFSAPPCSAGRMVRVTFARAGAAKANITNFRPCAATSSNFLVAGLYPATGYSMNYEVKLGSIINAGPTPLSIVTGIAPAGFISTTSLIVPRTGQSSSEWMTLIGFPASGPSVAAAYDKLGRYVWYYPDRTSDGVITRLIADGTMTAIVTGSGTGAGFFGPNNTRQQILREIDLAGNVLHEITADRVSEILQAQGKDALGRFNHDAIRLRNGHTIALGDSQRVFPRGTQGSPFPIAVIGAVIIDFDPNWNVSWTWSAFDHSGGGGQLDINRAATLGETCLYGTNGQTQVGCPSVLLNGFQSARDWTHSNALDLMPDGNLIMSIRNQDWIVRIDYANGAGTGDILWRMGLGGDFTFLNNLNDSYPWFSHQHEAAFEFNGSQYLSLYDNGNVRIAQNGGHSRGQVLIVDENAMTVTFFLNADLGISSSAHGSAQALANGNWHFGGDASNTATRAIETIDTGDSQAFSLQGNGSYAYRSWRLSSFYTPPRN